MTICTHPTAAAYCLQAAMALVVTASLHGIASAEEGGSGHYTPGSMASFIDIVPAKETFVARFNYLNYDGSFSKQLPFAGLVVAEAEAKSSAYGLTLVWRPPIEIGPGWSYAMSATIPYVTLEVSGNVQSGAGAATGPRSERTTGLGDVVLIPLMLNYIFDPDFSTNFRVTAYAPTGSYELGRLANTGKNFWTIEPTLALMYFGQQNGIEASLFTGISFNRENPDTQYKSGTSLHFDGTLAQHFPFAGGLTGVGLSGFYYEQISGDSGAGATFGDFKSRTMGLGLAASYVAKLGGNDTVTELKWMRESNTRNRLEGDYLWFKFLYKFY